MVRRAVMVAHVTDLPSSPDDDAARAAAAKKIASRVGLWGVPITAIAILCVLLGVPWWLVAGGIVAFVAIILFDT